MLSKKVIRKALQGRTMTIGLRSATDSEIFHIKRKLTDLNIKFKHRCAFRHNGVLVINPKKPYHLTF